METTELKMINLSALVPSKTNPRKLFDEAALQELAASIKENGVLQPIVVRKQGKTKYEVVCGHRRYRASLLAEIETIPAVIRDLHDDEALELQEKATKRAARVKQRIEALKKKEAEA